eukprot:TRINITY_DN57377_c0_g1_i1.p1 TRINITY_DN57377_c0_g1~~TRINITY_DN57377_c0_g1_i1.p1  ORF type:complete len:713 (-),score=130.20 TRINITY_DN57377_c0_g1_i1:6-2144(-)
MSEQVHSISPPISPRKGGCGVVLAPKSAAGLSDEGSTTLVGSSAVGLAEKGPPRASSPSLVSAVSDAVEISVHVRLSDEEESRAIVDTAPLLLDVSMPVAQPPTTPRSFSASYRRGAASDQLKASWSSTNYNALKSIPTTAEGSSRGLMHTSLERQLVAKVLDREPNRSAVGISDMVIRDMANSVVREMVGIFESLIDRLLIEKKQDTLRTLVAELMTQDLASTISVATDQLKRKELGHLSDDLGRLRGDLQEKSGTLEDCVQYVQELHASQTDLWTTLTERIEKFEARVSDVEHHFAKRDELEFLRDRTMSDLEDMQRHIAEAAKGIEKRAEDVMQLDAVCKESFPTKVELAEVAVRLESQASNIQDHLQLGLRTLTESAATRDEHLVLQAAHDEAQRAHRTSFFKLESDVDMLNTILKKSQTQNAESYVTKYMQAQELGSLRKLMEKQESELKREILDVSETNSTKTALKEVQGTLLNKLGELESIHAVTVSAMEKMRVDILELERKQANFATREYALDVAHAESHQIAQQCDEKEAIALLRQGFEEERERHRQTIRQQQLTRHDLDDAIAQVHSLETRTTDLLRGCDSIREKVERVDEREVKDWQLLRTMMDSHKSSQSELFELYRNLRGEVHSQTAMQTTESERLRHNSTQRYLEQMDKALKLHKKLESIETEQDSRIDALLTARGLPPPAVPLVTADVGRGLKLPKV